MDKATNFVVFSYSRFLNESKARVGIKERKEKEGNSEAEKNNEEKKRKKNTKREENNKKKNRTRADEIPEIKQKRKTKD